MRPTGRLVIRMTGMAGMAGVVALSSGCAALDQFQHATTLTFRTDTMECGPVTGSQFLCEFAAYYGNVSKKPIQVDPTTTRVVDRKGNVLQPVAEPGTGDSFLLKPGAQHFVSWTVTVPAGAKPAKVSWHGTSVSVQLDPDPVPTLTAPASATPSAAPSVPSVPSVTPPPTTAATTTTAVATTPVTTSPPTTKPTTTKPTTTRPTTTAPTTTRPTTTKPKPTTTSPTVRPTTTEPRPTRTVPVTTPPPQTTTSRPRPTHTTPPTTNPTNPGGGSGGIG